MGPDWLYRVLTSEPHPDHPDCRRTVLRYSVDVDEANRWRNEAHAAGSGAWVESAVVGDFWPVPVPFDGEP